MKKLVSIFTILSIIVFFTSMAVKANTGKEYPKTFVVIDVTEKEVTCIDFNGNKWAFDNTEGDWLIGDYASAIMNNNGTENIYDDYFISVEYSGWLDGAWGYDHETGNPIIIISEP